MIVKICIGFIIIVHFLTLLVAFSVIFESRQNALDVWYYREFVKSSLKNANNAIEILIVAIRSYVPRNIFIEKSMSERRQFILTSFCSYLLLGIKSQNNRFSYVQLRDKRAKYRK